jgi:hypothetical protein
VQPVAGTTTTKKNLKNITGPDIIHLFYPLKERVVFRIAKDELSALIILFYNNLS